MKIRIGSHDYDLVLRDMKDSSRNGTESYDELIIVVNTDKNLAPMRRYEVFVHEVLHAMNRQLAIWTDDAKEEEVIDRLAPMLLRFMLDEWPKALKKIR